MTAEIAALSAPTIVPVTRRTGFAFSPAGSRAASLAVTGDSIALETWRLEPRGAIHRALPEVPVSSAASVLPLDRDEVLVLDRQGHAVGDPHVVTMVSVDSESPSRCRMLGTLTALGGYLMPAPSWGLGLVVTVDDDERSTVWLLNRDGTPTPAARVPGLLSGGAWLDEPSGLLALNRSEAGRPAEGIAVDLRSGEQRCIWSVSASSTDRILLADRRAQVIVVSTTASGQARLGWLRYGEQEVHLPDTLHQPGPSMQALAVADHSARLLLHRSAGALSQLLVYEPFDDRLTPIDCPPGTVYAPACWHGDLIRIPFSRPTHPPTLATLRVPRHREGPAPEWSVPPDPVTAGRRDLADAALIRVPGADTSIEAMVYGGSEWLYAPRLVVALHGGPLSVWRFEFNPLFQALADAGIAVVAPNQRGSTGYGDSHMRAAIGDWGGADLADIRAIGRRIAQDRDRYGLPRPVVLGCSYGGYLSLLAACTEPEAWSGCVALAPFLSAAGLYQAGGTAVRRRIAELGGMRAIPDPTTPRDVLRACPALTVPLLLVHGADDERVPVTQSRTLRDRLLELGRVDGHDVDYLELDTDHDGVVSHWPPPLLRRVTRFCLGLDAVSGYSRDRSHTPIDVERR